MMGITHWRALLALGQPRHFSSGDVLMRQGDEGHFVLALITGRVKISLLEPDGIELPIAVRYPGEVLGDISVLGSRPRTATVVAIDKCAVRLVLALQFKRFVAANGLDALIMNHSMTRLREAEQRRVELVAYPVGQRLCRMLLRLATEDGPHWVVDLNMSQEEFGRLVGASRNAIGLVLSRLRDFGVVDTHRRAVIIKDVSALRRYAERGIPDRDSAD
jgi:CRP/FNR family cyclic AMP-dependent transcriptional regulator